MSLENSTGDPARTDTSLSNGEDTEGPALRDGFAAKKK